MAQLSSQHPDAHVFDSLPGAADLLAPALLADFRRQKIGFIFQLFNLAPMLTALENVMLPLLPYRRGLSFNLKERAQELLGVVGLGERLHRLPGQLPGGEQQRVAIARALVNHPKVILADEPTGNVESRAGQEIVGLLGCLDRELGLTVVLVTHNAALATQRRHHTLHGGRCSRRLPGPRHRVPGARCLAVQDRIGETARGIDGVRECWVV